MIVVPNGGCSFWREIRCAIRAYGCDVAQPLLAHDALHVVGERTHVYMLTRYNPPLAGLENLEPRGRAKPQHVIDETGRVAVLPLEGSVVHRHQPARADVFGELGGLHGIE